MGPIGKRKTDKSSKESSNMIDESQLSGPALKRLKKQKMMQDSISGTNKGGDFDGGDDNDNDQQHALNQNLKSSSTSKLSKSDEKKKSKDAAKKLLQSQSLLNQGKKLLPRNDEEKKAPGDRVVVILEKAFLELVQIKSGGGQELLNADDHKTIILKKGSNAPSELADARPDITHQCLMTLLDSPLNKKGQLLIYIHTAQNVLIEVHPSLRVPRTFKRFCGLFVELLQRGKIRAKQSNEILLKVISNPIEKYLPPGGRRIGLSVNGTGVCVREFCRGLVEGREKNMKKEENSETNLPITFVIGAVAHCDPVNETKFGAEYVQEQISISNFGLSASTVCGKLINEFEYLWGVR